MVFPSKTPLFNSLWSHQGDDFFFLTAAVCFLHAAPFFCPKLTRLHRNHLKLLNGYISPIWGEHDVEDGEKVSSLRSGMWIQAKYVTLLDLHPLVAMSPGGQCR